MNSPSNQEVPEGIDRWSFQADSDPECNGMICDEDGEFVRVRDLPLIESKVRAEVTERLLAVADKFEAKATEKFGLTEPGPDWDLWRGEGEAYATASNELRNVAAEIDPNHLDYSRLPLPAALSDTQEVQGG